MDKRWEAIQRAGYNVYQQDPKDSWCYYTDGTCIGYAQYDPMDGYSVSTVHVPCKRAGTGYAIARHVSELTPEIIENGLMNRPDWASKDDAIVKYTNWNHFHNSNKWHREYKKIEASI